jgi:hypothetical protein
MKKRICKSIICTLLIVTSLIGSVHCFAKSFTADEVNTRIGGIVSYRASSYNTKEEQGIVDYYSSHEMTLGGEWYVLSFIQNGDKLDYSSYSKSLISYLKNNEVYSATSREKFALTLIALKSTDSFAKEYISSVTNEAIGKQGIMSYVFGLHLLNNGCKSNDYTASSLVEKIISLQNEDGGWANSGSKSDVDVTAMSLEALYPYKSGYSSQINDAVSFLSSKQSENGDYQSYGAYNAESTAQVVIALSSLGINCSTDKRFVKDGNSVLDGLERYRNSDGSYSHKYGDSANDSATFQALNALVAYSRFIKGNGAFYSFEKKEEPTTASKTTEPHSAEKTTKTDNKTESNTTDAVTTVNSDKEEVNTVSNLSEINTEAITTQGNSNMNEAESEITENASQLTEIQTNAEKPLNGIMLSEGSIVLTNEFKTVLAIQFFVLLAAVVACVILFVLKKRNKKNFIVIGVIALILMFSAFFIRINSADEYYNSSVVKDNTVGVVTLTVRCDTIMGKDGAPENPVILEKSEYEIAEGDTVYTVLAEALQKEGILFEHNATYYISGIDNLYEFQFGDLSGWMYRVNGETPSVGCGEYALEDGDEIEWLYTCEIGNDLN